MIIAFAAGVAVGLLIAGVIALNVWEHRNPLTPEERADLDDEMRIW